MHASYIKQITYNLSQNFLQVLSYSKWMTNCDSHFTGFIKWLSYPIPCTRMPLRTRLFVAFLDHHLASVFTLGIWKLILSVIHTSPYPLLETSITSLSALQKSNNYEKLLLYDRFLFPYQESIQCKSMANKVMH